MTIRTKSMLAMVCVFGAGCCPTQQIHSTWTVASKTEDGKHIAVGDKFTIARTREGDVILPGQSLSERWGFTVKPLTKTGNLYCVEVNLGPDHVSQEEVGAGVEFHSVHWFTFVHVANREPSGLHIEYYTKLGSGHPCDVPSFHMGTAHAED